MVGRRRPATPGSHGHGLQRLGCPAANMPRHAGPAAVQVTTDLIERQVAGLQNVPGNLLAAVVEVATLEPSSAARLHGQQLWLLSAGRSGIAIQTIEIHLAVERRL